MEADLVNILVYEDISLVAQIDEGDIMFSLVYTFRKIAGMELTFLAVLTDSQNQEVGSALVRAGIEYAKREITT